MKLRKYREYDGGRILIGPAARKDDFLFQHCANGLSSVTTRDYNKYVMPMLSVHGVVLFTMTDET